MATKKQTDATDDAGVAKGNPGYATYVGPNGEAVTNEVDDIANPPEHRFDVAQSTGGYVSVPSAVAETRAKE